MKCQGRAGRDVVNDLPDGASFVSEPAQASSFSILMLPGRSLLAMSCFVVGTSGPGRSGRSGSQAVREYSYAHPAAVHAKIAPRLSRSWRDHLPVPTKPDRVHECRSHGLRRQRGDGPG